MLWAAPSRCRVLWRDHASTRGRRHLASPQCECELLQSHLEAFDSSTHAHQEPPPFLFMRQRLSISVSDISPHLLADPSSNAQTRAGLCFAAYVVDALVRTQYSCLISLAVRFKWCHTMIGEECERGVFASLGITSSVRERASRIALNIFTYCIRNANLAAGMLER
jgi:hypothetical protein